MALWQSKATTLEKQVEDLEASISTLTAERDEAVKAAEDLQEQIKAAEDAVKAAEAGVESKLKASADAHAKALADAKAEHEKALEQAKADHDKKVEDEVIRRAASAGIPPIATDRSVTGSEGGGNLTEQLASITDAAARTAFMQKHASALMAEARRKV
jgi:DNA repair exonuclease SbcCD ATPase subunit